MVWAAALMLMAGASNFSDPLESGNTFLDRCSVPAEKMDEITFGLCHGFINGLVARDVFASDRSICRPSGANNGQLMDVALAYLRANPQYRHIAPGALVAVALRNAFPCPAVKK